VFEFKFELNHIPISSDYAVRSVKQVVYLYFAKRRQNTEYDQEHI